MVTGRGFRHFTKTRRKFAKVQKVQLVKPKRKRRKGPRVTRLLKDKTVAHLRYVDTVTIDAGSAAIASHIFSCNGIFDPDITSTGHQYLMRDEYALLYNEYRVLSSKIKVTPITTSTSNTVPALWGVYRDTDVTLTYSGGTSVIEDQRNKGGWGIHVGLSTVQIQARGGSRRNTISATFNAKRDLSKDASTVTHLQSANPETTSPESMFYQIWNASILGNNPGAQSFLVQIDAIVEYTDPLVVTPS